MGFSGNGVDELGIENNDVRITPDRDFCAGVFQCRGMIFGGLCVKNTGASPEAFKNMNSPHEEKPKQASGY